MTADYVKERKQFGVPVGSFQAVKHHLANARIALEFARPLVYRAARRSTPAIPTHACTRRWRRRRPTPPRCVAAKAALQCHGAIGYTTEYDLHLYMKRAWALARSWGDATFHRGRVAARDPLDHRRRSHDARGLHHRRRAQPGRHGATAASPASTRPISARTRSAR